MPGPSRHKPYLAVGPVREIICHFSERRRLAPYHWAPVSHFTGDWILPSRKLVPEFEPGIYADCTVMSVAAQSIKTRVGVSQI